MNSVKSLFSGRLACMLPPAAEKAVSTRVKQVAATSYIPTSLGAKTEKKLTDRYLTKTPWSPFQGSLNFKKDKIALSEEQYEVAPDTLMSDKAVVLINHNHAAIMMGSYDSEFMVNPKKSNIPGAEEAMFSWYPEKNASSSLEDNAIPDKAITVGASSTLGGVALTGILAGTVGLSPVTAVGLIPTLTAVGAGGWAATMKHSFMNRLVRDTTSQGVNFYLDNPQTFSIPVSGLNVTAMKAKAAEIKAKGEFSLYGTNCSKSVLDILKAGLSESDAASMPSYWGWATPTDVERVVLNMKDQGTLQVGEVDEDGDVWFDPSS